MRTAGRPLRFIKLVVGGWIALRAATLLWSISGPAPQVALRPVDQRTPTFTLSARRYEVRKLLAVPASLRRRRMNAQGSAPAPAPGAAQPHIIPAAVDRIGFVPPPSAPVTPTMTGTPVGRRESRWSASAWMLWRPEAGKGLASAPLLGGSQAGVRLDYRLSGGVRNLLTLYGRASRAFAGSSSEEAALGIAWRPGRLPLSLLAERRQRLGPGGRNGFALLAAGGIGPRDIAPRVEVEGYAQAGIVGLPGSAAFADGKLGLGYRLTPRVSLGASVSGSVQPGASRLDIGPELKLRFRLSGADMSLSTEWRTRVAGEARPAHGPVLTLATQF